MYRLLCSVGLSVALLSRTTTLQTDRQVNAQLLTQVNRQVNTRVNRQVSHLSEPSRRNILLMSQISWVICKQKTNTLEFSSKVNRFVISGCMTTLLDLKLRPCMPCLQKAKTLSCRHTEGGRTDRLVWVVIWQRVRLFEADLRWFTNRLDLEVEDELSWQLPAGLQLPLKVHDPYTSCRKVTEQRTQVISNLKSETFHWNNYYIHQNKIV